MENIIRKLKIVRCEINQMPVNMFIRLKYILAQPVSRLINLTFKSGKFPTTPSKPLVKFPFSRKVVRNRLITIA